jgi:hypothetical protein
VCRQAPAGDDPASVDHNRHDPCDRISASMSEQQDQPKRKSRVDWRVKVGFVVVAVAVSFLIYIRQMADPKLPGWGTDLQAGLRQAKEKGTRVLVLFTGSPMSHDDRRLVKETVNTSRKQLNDLGYLAVHLHIREHKDIADRYGATSHPYLLLLDAEGTVVKKHSGFMSKESFRSDFLKVSSSQKEEPNESPKP